MKKILMMFRKGYEKWLRRRRSRAIWGRKFNEFYSEKYVSQQGFIKFSPESTRRMIEEAYPDGVK